MHRNLVYIPTCQQKTNQHAASPESCSHACARIMILHACMGVHKFRGGSRSHACMARQLMLRLRAHSRRWAFHGRPSWTMVLFGGVVPIRLYVFTFVYISVDVTLFLCSVTSGFPNQPKQGDLSSPSWKKVFMTGPELGLNSHQATSCRSKGELVLIWIILAPLIVPVSQLWCMCASPSRASDHPRVASHVQASLVQA